MFNGFITLWILETFLAIRAALITAMNWAKHWLYVPLDENLLDFAFNIAETSQQFPCQKG
jgi:hypothetical protein